MSIHTDAVSILSRLIEYPTITPCEGGIYSYIRSLLPGFECVEISQPAPYPEAKITKNILLFRLPEPLQQDIKKHILASLEGVEPGLDHDSRPGRVGSPKDESRGHVRECFARLRHLCFAGHVDVVPPGDIKKWTHDPFRATVSKDHQDAREAEIARNASAASHGCDSRFRQEGEEYIYGRGAQDMKGGIACFISAISRFLESKSNDEFVISILLTSDEEGSGEYGTKYILDKLIEIGIKPTHVIVAEPTSDKVLGDVIKTGRRGSINGKIVVHGKQGHVAYPNKCINPIDLISDRLRMLSGVNLCDGDDHFLPSKLVATSIHAGTGAVNVVPGDVEVVFNVRNSTLIDIKYVEEYVHRILSGLSYTLEVKQSAMPFITHDSGLIGMMKRCIVHICGIEPRCNTVGGTSDARFFAQHGIPVIEVGVCNDRIHSVDERVRVSELMKLEMVFHEFICQYSGLIPYRAKGNSD